jgi:tetratricopeptide (TPR) repeat protein
VQQRPAQDRTPAWITFAAAGVLTAAALLAYGNTFSVPLLFDDVTSIATNPTLHHFGDAFWPPTNRTVTGRPVLNVSLALNYAFGGSAVGGYHAANLAIHIFSGLALFGITRRTLLPRQPAAATAIGFSAALLWIVHPLGTAAVTYIAQRAESLMALFYLLTLYCFIRGTGDGSRKWSPWFGWAAAACLLGMATKEVMASAPLMVLLYDRTFIAGSFRGALRQRGRVHALLASTWLLLAFLAVTTQVRNAAGSSDAVPPAWHYALTQFPAIVHYLGLCFWPYPLVFDYGTALAAPSLAVLLSAVLVAALLAAVAWALIKVPALGFPGACFFAVLAPSSSFVPIAGETMADFRMYLPLACVATLTAAALFRYLGRTALPVCLVLSAALGLVSRVRNEDYASAERIWSDTVAKAPGNARAHSNLGALLLNEPGKTQEAIAQSEEALRLLPDSAPGHVDLANALSRDPALIGDAITHYREAIRINPRLYGAHVGLGNALSRVPETRDEAIGEYTEALRLKPDSAEAHFDLGNALSRTPGRNEEAIDHYRQALRLKPDFAEAHFGLAVALLDQPGGKLEAEAQLEEGLRLHPSDKQAQYILERLRAGP